MGHCRLLMSRCVLGLIPGSRRYNVPIIQCCSISFPQLAFGCFLQKPGPLSIPVRSSRQGRMLPRYMGSTGHLRRPPVASVRSTARINNTRRRLRLEMGGLGESIRNALRGFTHPNLDPRMLSKSPRGLRAVQIRFCRGWWISPVQQDEQDEGSS